MVMRKDMPVHEVELNLPQMVVMQAEQKHVILEWGRGTGKSTVISKRFYDLSVELPRAKFSLVGTSYKQVLSETLPSTKEGLEMLFRWKENVHYVVGRRHKDWPVCYQAPDGDAWKHCIHVYTGAVFQLAGQDRTVHRGRNIMGWLGDEGALLNKQQLDTDIISTNRAGKKYFDGHPLLNSSLLASTIPLTLEGRWFSEMDQEAKMHPDKYLFLRASALHNKHNLSDDYFETQKQIMEPWLYDIEVLNIRPAKVADGFYPTLDPKKHYYTKYNYEYIDLENTELDLKNITCKGDDDHDPNKPLILGIDWGARINSLVVAQKFITPNELRFLKNFFVKHPRIIDDLVNDFSDYYHTHQKRIVQLYYDRSGNNRQANSKLTYAEQMKKALESRGWTVQLMTPHGLDPYHSDKHIVIARTLKEDNPRLPRIRINKHNCKEMIISLENAGAKDEGGGRIGKDKSTERSKTLPQEESTHLSDAFDLPVYNIIKPIISNKIIEGDLITR